VTYGIYWLGLPVYGGRVQVKFDESIYDIRVSNKSRGIMNLIKRSKHEITASGRIDGALRSVQRYRLLSFVGQKRIRVEITRNEAGLMQASRLVRPPARITNNRPVVSRARMDEAFDPAAGFLFGVMQPHNGRPCSRRVPFFDGMRRFDIAFSGPLESSSARGKPVPLGTRAVLCRIHVHQIAGFTKSEARDMDVAVKRMATVRFVWTPQHRVWFPVRIEYASKWGPISIELLRVWADDRVD